MGGYLVEGYITGEGDGERGGAGFPLQRLAPGARAGEEQVEVGMFREETGEGVEDPIKAFITKLGAGGAEDEFALQSQTLAEGGGGLGFGLKPADAVDRYAGRDTGREEGSEERLQRVAREDRAGRLTEVGLEPERRRFSMAGAEKGSSSERIAPERSKRSSAIRGMPRRRAAMAAARPIGPEK